MITLGNRIQLKIEEPKAGDLALGGMNVAKEIGEVIGVGKDVTLPIKKGDRVMFKSWAVDIINDEGMNYYFISQSTDGICAKL